MPYPCTYTLSIIIQIADTCGRLLADAMAAHMEREEWAELDRDDFYVAQVPYQDRYQGRD